MRYLIPVLLALGLAAAPLSLADGGAVKTMAKILVDLNHFPSDADKQKLEAIIEDDASNDNERTVASALLNMQHQVSGDDKAALEALAGDNTADKKLRSLAEVLANVNHAPNDAQKETLKGLTKKRK